LFQCNDIEPLLAFTGRVFPEATAGFPAAGDVLVGAGADAFTGVPVGFEDIFCCLTCPYVDKEKTADINSRTAECNFIELINEAPFDKRKNTVILINKRQVGHYNYKGLCLLCLSKKCLKL